MKLQSLLQSVSVAAFALTMMVPAASAITITYETDGSGTGFNGTSNLTLLNTFGVGATLAFLPNELSVSGVPSNINYGDFTLACPSCGTQASGTGSTFNPFTFTIQVTDLTNTATGNFVGTSSGGEVFSDVSSIQLFWTPEQLGPGALNATGGTSFDYTSFRIVGFTPIVAPNSGTPPGLSTVEGFVNSEVPEPATIGLVGCVLVGLGLWRRRSMA